MSVRRNTVHNVPCKVDGVDCTAIAWIQETELIRLDSMFPEADPDWRYLDKAGHMHRPAVTKDAVGHEYVTSWPTLTAIYEEPWYCNDCRDTHSFVDHYECSICAETIKPSYRPPTPSYTSGPKSAWVKVMTNKAELATGLNRDDFVVEIENQRFLATRGDVCMSSNEPLKITFHIIKPLEEPNADRTH